MHRPGYTVFLVALALLSCISFCNAFLEFKQLNTYLEIQDKVCTISYVSGHFSYRKLVKKLFGLPSLKTMDTLKQPREYTGFKLLKKHYIKNGITGLQTDMSFNYCHEGKLILTKAFNIGGPALEYGWDAPICVYSNIGVSMFDKINQSEIITANSAPFQKHNLTILQRLKLKIIKFLKLENRFSLFYNLETPTPNDLALNNTSRFHCFKYSRKKKYASSNLNIFFPQQWVGGLFYCDLTHEEKQNLLLNGLDSNLNFVDPEQSFHHVCTPNNAIPLLPAIVDQYKNYWTDSRQYKQGGSNSAYVEAVKIIPYLYTPHAVNVLDLKNRLMAPKNQTRNATYHSESLPATSLSHTWKFKAIDIFRKTPFMKKHQKWFNEISVDEHYTYEKDDLNKLEQLVQYTLQKIQNISDSNRIDEYTIWKFNNDGIGTASIHKLHNLVLTTYMGLEDMVMEFISSKLFKKELQLIHDMSSKIHLKSDTYAYLNSPK